ncbi:hypothetical protein PAHAL_3G268400 [Panicum hallii]|uniref:Uncharacterized protein n=1 Tax=Panicum hallii TaxID=206008 RepID=A0A2S3HC40_9POAL|nr:uncharacterized protein LOC112887739 [Panicum hallii]PAN19392.2 hypothetical protein PAHAL_3G268400 [Panicum hallii]
MEIKMDKMVIIVSAVVGSLGALSAILGFAAEGENAINPNPSPGLGICAALFLLVAQTTVSAVAAVGYCKFRPVLSETKQTIILVSGVVSWIGTVIASVLFLFGASQNANGRSSGGMYAGAAVLTVAATALGITSFIMLRRQPAEDAPNKPAGEQPPPAGIATGQQAGVAGVYGSQAPHQQPPPPAQGNGTTTQAPSQQFAPPQGHEHV